MTEPTTKPDTQSGSQPTPLAMDGPAILAFLAKVFPQAQQFGFEIDAIDPGGVTLGLTVRDDHLRPGGTVSGPTLMTLADTGMYLTILSRLGPKALAVTTNLNMNFLRRPAGQRLSARCELLKLGKRLAVGDVRITIDGAPDPVAHATATYSIPPER